MKDEIVEFILWELYGIDWVERRKNGSSCSMMVCWCYVIVWWCYMWMKYNSII